MSDLYREIAGLLFEDVEPMEFPFGPTAKALQKESDAAGYDKSKYSSRAAAEAAKLGLVSTGFGRYAHPNNPGKTVAKSIPDGDDYRLVKVGEGEVDDTEIEREPSDDEKAAWTSKHGESESKPQQVEPPTDQDWETFKRDPQAFKQYLDKYLASFNLEDPANVERITFRHPMRGVTAMDKKRKPELTPLGKTGTSAPKSYLRGVRGIYADPDGNKVLVFNGKAKRIPDRTLGNTALQTAREFEAQQEQPAEEPPMNQTAERPVPTPAPATRPSNVRAVVQAAAPTTVFAALKPYAAATLDRKLSEVPENLGPTFKFFAVRVRGDIHDFIANPTPERARALIAQYGLRTNGVDKALIIGSAVDNMRSGDRQNPELVKTARTMFDASKPLDQMHPEYGKVKLGEYVMGLLRQQLGDAEYESSVKVDAGIVSMVQPTFIFNNAHREVQVQLEPTATYIDDIPYSKVFSKVSPEDRPRLKDRLVERRILQRARAMVEIYRGKAGQGLLAGDISPEDAAERAINVFEHRNASLEVLGRLSGKQVADFERFRGTNQTEKIVYSLTDGIRRAANRLDNGLTAQDHHVLDILEELGQLQANPELSPGNTSLESAFENHWKKVLDAVSHPGCTLTPAMPKIAEWLTAARLSINGHRVYMPMDDSFPMVDAIGISDVEQFNALDDVERFVDAVELIHVSTDLSSTKKGEKGAAPSVSSILPYVKFDEKSPFKTGPMPPEWDSSPGVSKAGKMSRVVPFPEDILDANFVTNGARYYLANEQLGQEYVTKVEGRAKQIIDHPDIAKDIRRYFRFDETTTAEQIMELLQEGRRWKKVPNANDPNKETFVHDDDTRMSTPLRKLADGGGTGLRRGQLSSVFGYLTEYMLNTQIRTQAFRNEAFKDQGGGTIERTNGIDSIAMFEFEGVQLKRDAVAPFGFYLNKSTREGARDAGSIGAQRRTRDDINADRAALAQQAQARQQAKKAKERAERAKQRAKEKAAAQRVSQAVAAIRQRD